jgi:hypothetical protein
MSDVLQKALAAYLRSLRDRGEGVVVCDHVHGTAGLVGHRQVSPRPGRPVFGDVRLPRSRRHRRAGARPLAGAEARRDDLARTDAIRKLRKVGYALRPGEKWPDLLLPMTEDQKRGLPHLHGVLGHTTRLEKAYANAFLDALPRAARHHGLGFTDRYGWVVQKRSKYEAGRLRHYITKLCRYLAQDAHGAEFLQLHHGKRIFYVGPWLTRLSGLTMTIARLCRRVWASRHGYCDPPKMRADQEAIVLRVLELVVEAPNAP